MMKILVSALNVWKTITWFNNGIIHKDKISIAMGHYIFKNNEKEVKAEYTFVQKKMLLKIKNNSTPFVSSYLILNFVFQIIVLILFLENKFYIQLDKILLNQ